MKVNRYIKIVAVILFLIFAFWKYYSTDREVNKLYEELQSEYNWLNIDDGIDNVIIKTYYPSEWRGEAFFQYITLDDGRKFSVNIDRGITNQDIYYGSVAKQGARIIKKVGSDTLIVFKDDKEFLFLIKNNDDEVNNE